MRKSITAGVVGLIIGVASSAAGATFAICIEEAGDGFNTGAYWTRGVNEDGSFLAEQAFRRILQNRGERVDTCRAFHSSYTNFDGGYWAVVHNNRHAGRLILGIGFSLQSSSQAVEQALGDLSDRDLLWVERHGHSVVASDLFF